MPLTLKPNIQQAAGNVLQSDPRVKIYHTIQGPYYDGEYWYIGAINQETDSSEKMNELTCILKYDMYGNRILKSEPLSIDPP